MRVDERLEQREELCGGRDGRVDEEATRLEPEHGHAYRHVYIVDADELVEAPHAYMASTWASLNTPQNTPQTGRGGPLRAGAGAARSLIWR